MMGSVWKSHWIIDRFGQKFKWHLVFKLFSLTDYGWSLFTCIGHWATFWIFSRSWRLSISSLLFHLTFAHQFFQPLFVDKILVRKWILQFLFSLIKLTTPPPSPRKQNTHTKQPHQTNNNKTENKPLFKAEFCCSTAGVVIKAEKSTSSLQLHSWRQ